MTDVSTASATVILRVKWYPSGSPTSLHLTLRMTTVDSHYHQQSFSRLHQPFANSYKLLLSTSVIRTAVNFYSQTHCTDKVHRVKTDILTNWTIWENIHHRCEMITIAFENLQRKHKIIYTREIIHNTLTLNAVTYYCVQTFLSPFSLYSVHVLRLLLNER